MYSVVLATMLSAGSAAPDFHRHNSCYGCYGCYSGYSCYSSCGCYGGYGCYGCYSGYSGYSGYGCHRIFPIFHRNYCGGYTYPSCSCACSGMVYSSCSTCCGGVMVAPVCCGGTIVNPPKVIPVPEKVNPPKKTGGEGSVGIPSNVARVTVNLPSDARLWVENVEAPLTSAVRSFNTPVLNPNQQYFYNIRAAIVRDGRTITETQRVVITPGQETRVDFNTSNVIGVAAR